jgi:hypothetical protein
MASPWFACNKSSLISLYFVLRLIERTASSKRSFATIRFTLGISFAYRTDRRPVAARASRIVKLVDVKAGWGYRLELSAICALSRLHLKSDCVFSPTCSSSVTSWLDSAAARDCRLNTAWKFRDQSIKLSLYLVLP